jgi:hypothetical protein
MFFPALRRLSIWVESIDTFPLASIDMPHVLASWSASSMFARSLSIPFAPVLQISAVLMRWFTCRSIEEIC